MTRPGPKPKPRLQVVREGNPGRRPVREGILTAPSAPPEPDWSTWFPSTDKPRGGNAADRNVAARARARQEWRRVVPVLDSVGILSELDGTVLADYCVLIVRLEEAEQHVSKHGQAFMGRLGWQKNPSITAANQYRAQLKFYIAELGLSPSSRGRINPPDGGAQDDDEGNPFDV